MLFKYLASYDHPPIPADETRVAVAYDANHCEIGRFEIPAADCLDKDTITWRGYYWSLQLLARYGHTLYRAASWFGFDDARPLSAIR